MWMTITMVITTAAVTFTAAAAKLRRAVGLKVP